MYFVEYDGRLYDRKEENYSSKDNYCVCEVCHVELHFRSFPMRHKDAARGATCERCLSGDFDRALQYTVDAKAYREKLRAIEGNEYMLSRFQRIEEDEPDSTLVKQTEFKNPI